MEKNTQGSSAPTPKRSPDTKSKSRNASPDVKTGEKALGSSNASTTNKAPTATADQGSDANKSKSKNASPNVKTGKIPGSSNAPTPKKTPATAPQSIDAQAVIYPKFHHKVDKTPHRFGLASNRESVFTGEPNLDPVGRVIPPEMFHEERFPDNGEPLVGFATSNGEGNEEVEIPLNRRWIFKRDWIEHFFTIKSDENSIVTTSTAATMSIRDDNLNDYYWIKCTSLEDYFKDISMEINILNTLSQDPEGRRFFPRIQFYNYWDTADEQRLLFGCTDYKMSLHAWLESFAQVGMNLHLIRCIMKQLLEAVLVLRKYGISNTLDFHPRNIRMGAQNNVAIVVTNFNRATTSDYTPEKRDMNEYTPVDVIFGLQKKNNRWEEWSVAAIAYRMLVGYPNCLVVDRSEQLADVLLFGAYEFLGAPKMDIKGRMEEWFKKDVKGKYDLKADWMKKKNAHLLTKHLLIRDLPRSFKGLKGFAPETYKTPDQKKDLSLLVNVIENMYRYDPNARTEAGKMLNDPFFDLSKNMCSIKYKKDAQDVYDQKTQVIARLSSQSTSKEAGH